MLFLNWGLLCYRAMPWPSAEGGKAEGATWKALREAERIENTATNGAKYMRKEHRI